MGVGDVLVPRWPTTCFRRNSHSDGMDSGERVAVMDEDSSSEESRDVDTLAEIRSFRKVEEVARKNKKRKDGVRDTLFQVCAAWPEPVLGSSTSGVWNRRGGGGHLFHRDPELQVLSRLLDCLVPRGDSQTK